MKYCYQVSFGNGRLPQTGFHLSLAELKKEIKKVSKNIDSKYYKYDIWDENCDFSIESIGAENWRVYDCERNLVKMCRSLNDALNAVKNF